MITIIMVKILRSPPVTKPFPRTFSFYVILGTLSALLWVVASLTNGGGLPTLPKFGSFREIRNIAKSYNRYTPLNPKQSREQPISFQSTEELLAAIRAVTARAESSGPVIPFGEEEEELWHKENSCRSRTELPQKYASRKIAQDVAPNSAWQEIYGEYTKMHRACMSRVGNADDYFLSKNHSTGCKFLVVELPKVGLGNKMLYKASAMLFAVLTQRVILIPDQLSITEHLCEPFVGSSWKLDINSKIREHQSSWLSAREFQFWVDKTEYKNRTQPDEVYAVDLADLYQPFYRYYCNTEQAYLSKVPWISMSGCLHFLPKIFSIPAFRPALEDLFPDRMALTHILRSVFLPSDPIWERIDNINDLYLRRTRSLLGVQLRYFQRQARQYKKLNQLVNKRVMECATTNGLLPEALPLGEYPLMRDSDHHERNTSKVFIASLFPGLHDYLKQIYVRRMTATGEGVGVVQLTHETEQHFGPEVDVEAFVEIICLSLSDALIITPVSTFGGLAEAYGALKPWFINFDDDGGPACERAQSVDVCFDQASDKFICPHDPEVHGLSIIDSVPYIEKCLKKDSHGVQLITSHESNPISSKR